MYVCGNYTIVAEQSLKISLYFSLAKLNNLKRHGKDTNMDDNIKIPAAAFMTMVGGAGKIIVLKVDSEKPDH